MVVLVIIYKISAIFFFLLKNPTKVIVLVDSI